MPPSKPALHTTPTAKMYIVHSPCLEIATARKVRRRKANGQFMSCREVRRAERLDVLKRVWPAIWEGLVVGIILGVLSIGVYLAVTP